MNENDVQQQVIALVQKAMQGDQEANQQIKQIMQAAQQGNQQAQQIAQMIQQVAQQMQRQAKYGTKLTYINFLQGKCPDGYEMGYYQKGGKVCKACLKAQKGAKTSDPFKLSKKDRDVVEQFKKDYASGKDLAEKDSIIANKYNDQEVQVFKPGFYKNGKWNPDRTQEPYKSDTKRRQQQAQKKK